MTTRFLVFFALAFSFFGGPWGYNIAYAVNNDFNWGQTCNDASNLITRPLSPTNYNEYVLIAPNGYAVSGSFNGFTDYIFGRVVGGTGSIDLDTFVKPHGMTSPNGTWTALEVTRNENPYGDYTAAFIRANYTVEAEYSIVYPCPGGGVTTTDSNNLAIPWTLSAMALTTLYDSVYIGIFFMATYLIFGGIAFFLQKCVNLITGP